MKTLTEIDDNGDKRTRPHVKKAKTEKQAVSSPHWILGKHQLPLKFIVLPGTRYNFQKTDPLYSKPTILCTNDFS